MSLAVPTPAARKPLISAGAAANARFAGRVTEQSHRATDRPSVWVNWSICQPHVSCIRPQPVGREKRDVFRADAVSALWAVQPSRPGLGVPSSHDKNAKWLKCSPAIPQEHFRVEYMLNHIERGNYPESVRLTRQIGKTCPTISIPIALARALLAIDTPAKFTPQLSKSLQKAPIKASDIQDLCWTTRRQFRVRQLPVATFSGIGSPRLVTNAPIQIIE